MSLLPSSIRERIISFMRAHTAAAILDSSRSDLKPVSAGQELLSFSQTPKTAVPREHSIIASKAHLPQSPVEVKRMVPFSDGERLVYQIRYKGMKIGQATLTFYGEKEHEGRQLYFITLKTDTLYFKDLEEMYAQKGTFLPIEIKRTIKKLGSPTMTIKESYDQEQHSITINKAGMFLSKETTIQKSSEIHNAILVSYYYRTQGEFAKNEKITVNLPTRQFELGFEGSQEVSVPLGNFTAYVFKGASSDFQFWLKDDEAKTPLKIEDSGLFGYSLLLSSVETAD